MTYCEAVASGKIDPVHIAYHDKAYGFPLDSDNELFGRLILEINQAGLSWTTILKKEEGFREAYSQFRISHVADYNDDDRIRLLSDSRIIRNRLKVNAAIYNANQIREIQKTFGSFSAWLDHHHPSTKAEWVKLFKSTFKFTGGEITGEFLMSTGYLPGAHSPNCPIFEKVASHSPPWMKR